MFRCETHRRRARLHGYREKPGWQREDTVFFIGGYEHGNWQGKGGIQGKCDIFPPAAIKFSMVDGVLNGKVLWSEPVGKVGVSHGGILYHDRKFYYPGGRSHGPC